MPSQAKPDRLLTTKEAAAFLAVSPAFLERDRWQGPTIPFIRVGKHRVRYRLSTLEAYINRRQSNNRSVVRRQPKKRRRRTP